MALERLWCSLRAVNFDGVHVIHLASRYWLPYYRDERGEVGEDGKEEIE